MTVDLRSPFPSKFYNQRPSRLLPDQFCIVCTVSHSRHQTLARRWKYIRDLTMLRVAGALRASTRGAAPLRGRHKVPTRLSGTKARSSQSGVEATGELCPRQDAADVSDSMARWPGLTSTAGALRSLDWIGTVSFAHSGAILAAASGMDALGCLVVGTVTAVGGGTVRDAVFLSRRPFWVDETEYIWLCLGTTAATFALWPHIRHYLSEDDNVFFAGDTLGVGAFCVIGAQNGIRAGVPPLISLICGVATATFGGAIRDVLCKRDVRILHSHAEIYASTAASGAAAYIAARALGASRTIKVAAGVGVAVSLRCAAWKNGIRLPVWPEAKGEVAVA